MLSGNTFIGAGLGRAEGGISCFRRDGGNDDGATVGSVVLLSETVMESFVGILTIAGLGGDRGVAFCALPGLREVTCGCIFVVCAVGLGLGLKACLTLWTTRFEPRSSSVLSQFIKEVSGSYVVRNGSEGSGFSVNGFAIG